jgi:hypothetical protein
MPLPIPDPDPFADAHGGHAITHGIDDAGAIAVRHDALAARRAALLDLTSDGLTPRSQA